MLRSCPFCAEKIQKKAKICRFCSSKVEPIYVENAAANKQVCAVVDLFQDGKGAEEIAIILNERGERTLDSNDLWSPARIQTIINTFCIEPKESSVISQAPKHGPHLINGALRTEQWQCYCSNCKRSQVEIVSYEEGKCNHVLHAIISVLTFVWVVGWLVIYLNAQSITNRNRRIAIAEKKCDQCGHRLIPLNE